jgi:hypothetical protein
MVLSSALADGRVEVRTDSGGRKLVALQRLRAGEIVLVAEPYAAVLDEAARNVRCDHTFATAGEAGGGSLLRCSISKVARYASREAQAAAWRSGYKEECAALVACAPRVPPPTVRLAARVLWRRRRERSLAPGSDAVYAEAACPKIGLGAGYDAVDALVDHWGALSDDEKAHCAQAAVAALAFVDARLTGKGIDERSAVDNMESTGSMDGTSHADDVPYANRTGATNDHPHEAHLAVAKLIAKMSHNCHTICDDELNPVGLGLYPPAATMNHSCVPNCCVTFKGKTLYVRCLSDCESGTELTIAYVELCAPRETRRNELKKHYKFDLDDAGVEDVKKDTVADTVAHSVKDTVAHSVTTKPTQIAQDTYLHDHGSQTTAVPSFRLDLFDRTRLCACRNGSNHSSEKEKSTSGGGVWIAGPAEKSNRVDVHVWGEFGGTGGHVDRGTVGIVAAEASRVLRDAETLADGFETSGVGNSPNELVGQNASAVLAKLTRAQSLAASLGGADVGLGEGHVLRVRAQTLALRVYIRTGAFEKAVAAAKSLLRPHRAAYPQNHPPLGLHLALLAKTEAYLGQNRAAAKHGAEAYAMLSVSHGTSSSLVKQVETTLRETRFELHKGDARDDEKPSLSDDEDGG